MVYSPVLENIVCGARNATSPTWFFKIQLLRNPVMKTGISLDLCATRLGTCPIWID